MVGKVSGLLRSGRLFRSAILQFFWLKFYITNDLPIFPTLYDHLF